MYTAARMSKIKAHAVFRDVFLKAKLGDFFSWYGMKVGEAFPAEQAENGGNNSAETTPAYEPYILPDYIVGSAGQLGEADIINRLYTAANGTTMEIVEYSGTGETYVNFFRNDEMVWSGVVNRYQTLDDGGLALMIEGDNIRTGESDYLEVGWSTMEVKDTPVVVHEADTVSIAGVYTFSFPLFGN